ncbi:MAG: Hsp70 family protein, partial [Anaerolineaceae bacterium]|nr:Hsp70 family protein [Anaerolineaceae bacterium]
ITITASSGLSDAEVDKMRQEAEANAEEDRQRKEMIEAKNHADNMVYTSEKTLKDLGDKVPADIKQKVEDAVAKVRDVKDGDDLEAIKSATDKLTEVLQEVGQAAYQQQPADAPDAADGKAAPEDKSGDDDEDVVDGEFKQV